MTEQNENKLGKLDIISSLQIKQTQTVSKKKEDDLLDDGWNDYSEEEEDVNQNIGENKGVVKVESKVKQYSNLKDYLGDDSNQVGHQKHNGGYNKNKKKHQGGTFYKEGRGDKKDFSRPVFTNSIKNNHYDTHHFSTENNPELDNIRNNNQEYSHRKPYNAYNTERKQYSNRNYNTNNYNNRDRNYQKYNSNQNDEKETVMKTINNFGNLMKNVNEENKNIKAPLKDYLDIDLGTDKYKKERNVNRTNNEVQRPTFINSALENQGNNFKELDKQGDLYLKKLQEKNIENLVEYSNKGNKNDNKERPKFRGTGNYLKNDDAQFNDEEASNRITDKVDNENDLNGQNSHSENFDSRFDGYRKNKKYSYNNNYNDEYLWSIATNPDEHKINNDNNYNTHNGTNDKPKPKKIIRRESNADDKKLEIKKNDSNLSCKDKVVVSIGNVKSIKDIFG